jgi:SAM-dependent methyltransferase
MADDTADGGHDHGDVRYLDAKESVDDRARNRRVVAELQRYCPSTPSVFDAGCGTGVALRRLREWGLDPATYHGVDQDDRLIEVARERSGVAESPDTPATEFTAGDAVAVARDVAATYPPADRPDLLVAQSFLDLVPVEDALGKFTDALAPGGLLYAPLTFDGVTNFQPDHPADAVVERQYHRSIDAVAGRDTDAGRHAVTVLQRAPGDLLAVGGSDWIVRPQCSENSESDDGSDSNGDPERDSGSDSDGRSDAGDYPADERYFLDRILGYVASSLLDTAVQRLSTADTNLIDTASVTVESGSFPEEGPADTDAIRDWLHTRRRQLTDGELSYFTHQFDILYRTPADGDDER